MHVPGCAILAHARPESHFSPGSLVATFLVVSACPVPCCRYTECRAWLWCTHHGHGTKDAHHTMHGSYTHTGFPDSQPWSASHGQPAMVSQPWDQGPRTKDQRPKPWDQRPKPWTKDQRPKPWTKAMDQSHGPRTKDQSHGPEPWTKAMDHGPKACISGHLAILAKPSNFMTFWCIFLNFWPFWPAFWTKCQRIGD